MKFQFSKSSPKVKLKSSNFILHCRKHGGRSSSRSIPAFQLGRMQHTSSRLVTGSDVHGSEAASHWFSCSWWCSFTKNLLATYEDIQPSKWCTIASILCLLEPEMYRVRNKSALSWGRGLKSTKWMPTDVRFEAFFAYFSETVGFDPQKTWTRARSAFPVITVTLDRKSRISRPLAVYMEQLTNAQWGNNRSHTWTGRRMSKAEVLLCKQTDVGGHQTVDH